MRHRFIKPEDRIDRPDFRMHVAHPGHAVALDPVPQILLHIQMHGVCPGLPNLVQARVIAGESTPVLKRSYLATGPDGDDRSFSAGFSQADIDKTKTGIANVAAAQTRQ